MTTYITQEQAGKLLDSVGGEWASCIKEDREFLHKSMNAAIQAYRDSLVDGMVLPEPVGFRIPEPDIADKLERIYTADQLRQAIADALAKQRLDNVLTKRARNPMFEFRECEDSQATSNPKEAP